MKSDTLSSAFLRGAAWCCCCRCSRCARTIIRSAHKDACCCCDPNWLVSLAVPVRVSLVRRERHFYAFIKTTSLCFLASRSTSFCFEIRDTLYGCSASGRAAPLDSRVQFNVMASFRDRTHFPGMWEQFPRNTRRNKPSPFLRRAFEIFELFVNWLLTWLLTPDPVTGLLIEYSTPSCCATWFTRVLLCAPVSHSVLQVEPRSFYLFIFFTGKKDGSERFSLYFSRRSF